MNFFGTNSELPWVFCKLYRFRQRGLPNSSCSSGDRRRKSYSYSHKPNVVEGGTVRVHWKSFDYLPLEWSIWTISFFKPVFSKVREKSRFQIERGIKSKKKYFIRKLFFLSVLSKGLLQPTCSGPNGPLSVLLAHFLVVQMDHSAQSTLIVADGAYEQLLIINTHFCMVPN